MVNIRFFIGAILQNSWIIWSHLLYFNFKNQKHPNSWSFIRFQCIVYDSTVTFFRPLKFPQIKDRGPNFMGGGSNSAEWLNYLSPLLYFNFKHLKNPNFSSLIRFHYIVHDSAVRFSDLQNFFKLKSTPHKKINCV